MTLGFQGFPQIQGNPNFHILGISLELGEPNFFKSHFDNEDQNLQGYNFSFLFSAIHRTQRSLISKNWKLSIFFILLLILKNWKISIPPDLGESPRFENSDSPRCRGIPESSVSPYCLIFNKKSLKYKIKIFQIIQGLSYFLLTIQIFFRIWDSSATSQCSGTQVAPPPQPEMPHIALFLGEGGIQDLNSKSKVISS